jgi:hypothetical protein
MPQTNRTTTAVTRKSRPNVRHYQRASKIFAANKEKRAANRRHPTNRQNPKQQLRQITATTTNAVIAKLWGICRKIAILTSRQMHQWWTNRAVLSHQTSPKLRGSRSSSRVSRSSSKDKRCKHSSSNNNSNMARSTSTLPLLLIPLHTQDQLSRWKELCGPAHPQWRL